MVHEHDHECGCGHHHHDEDPEHLHTNKYQQAFAPAFLLQGDLHQLHALFQTDPETGHAQVGDRKLCLSVCDELAEKRDN